jgi:hypothetical protein
MPFMKTIMAALICLSFVQFCDAREKEIKNPNFGGSPVLSLCYYSDVSYESAMNKCARLKPEGYVIESIEYIKVGRDFIVKVKMRKI